jgi:hypothetical protein
MVALLAVLESQRAFKYDFYNNFTKTASFVNRRNALYIARDSD